MSRKIFKNRDSINTEHFRFNESSVERSAAHTLEAEAELDAFQSDIFKSPMPKPTEGNALAERDAQAIIEQAQADADALIAAARVKAAEIEQQAYEQGLAEGRKTGEIVADQELQAILNIYHGSLGKLDQLRTVMVDQLQLDIMDLVIHITRKLIKSELQTFPATILAMIRDAVRSLKERKHLILYLSQEDYEYVGNLNEAEQQNWLGNDIQIESDRQLQRGSLRIETSAGELDGLIETKIQHIQEAMTTVFEQS